MNIPTFSREYIRKYFVSQQFHELFSYNKFMSIGKTIKELRKEKGLSQTKLAELLFTSQDTISLWECEKSLPNIKSLIEMTKIFNVSADYLLGLE